MSFNEVSSLAKEINQFPNLKLRGLMAIPAPHQTFEEQRQAFQKIYKTFQQLKQKGLDLDTLSMGMSDDFEAAIAEGSTMVRIGSTIFEG